MEPSVSGFCKMASILSVLQLKVPLSFLIVTLEGRFEKARRPCCPLSLA